MTNGFGSTVLSLSPPQGGREAGGGVGTGWSWGVLGPSPQEQAGGSRGRKWTGEASLGPCPYWFRSLPGDCSAFTLSLSLQEQRFPGEIKRKTGIFAAAPSQGLIKAPIPSHWWGEGFSPSRYGVIVKINPPYAQTQKVG